MTDAGDEERELRFYCGCGHLDGESGLNDSDDNLWSSRVTLSSRMSLMTGKWASDFVEG